MSPLCESFLRPSAPRTRWSPSIRCTCYVCEQCLLVQLEEYVSADDIFTEYAYFSSYSDSWVAPRRAATSTMIASGSVSTRQPGGRARQQRRLPAAVVRRRTACRCSASSPPRTWPRSRSARRPDAREFFGPEVAERARRRRRAPTSWSGTTCWPRCPTSTTSSPASHAAGAGRRGDDRVPAPRCASSPRTSSTPSTTSTSRYFSFLVVERIFAAHGLEAVRRRGAADATAARCGSTRCTRTRGRSPSTPAVEDAAAREERDAGVDHLEYYDSFERQVEETKRKLLDLLIAARREGKTICRLRRAGQGQHPAQLLRHPHRLPRLHRRPQPVQAGPLPARHPHPHLPRRTSTTASPTSS